MLHDSTFTRWKCGGNTGPLVARQAHHLPRPPPTPASGEGTGGRKRNTRHGEPQAPASKGAPLAKAPLKVPALNAATVEGALAVTPDTAHRPSGRLSAAQGSPGPPGPSSGRSCCSLKPTLRHLILMLLQKLERTGIYKYISDLSFPFLLFSIQHSLSLHFPC